MYKYTYAKSKVWGMRRSCYRGGPGPGPYAGGAGGAYTLADIFPIGFKIRFAKYQPRAAGRAFGTETPLIPSLETQREQR